MENPKDLNQLRVIKLREMAKEKNIQRYYKMNKAELVAALSNYSQKSERTISKNIKIKPVKRNPVMDNKLELKNVLKELKRNDCIKTKNGFQDTFQGEVIQYQIILLNDEPKLLIEKNDLIKQFDVEKKEMWKVIINYLKNVLYSVLETAEQYTRILDLDLDDEEDQHIPNFGGFAQAEEEVFPLPPEEKEQEKKEEGREKEKEDVIIKRGEKPAPPSSPPSPTTTSPEIPVQPEKIPYSEQERLTCPQKSRPMFLKRRMPSFMK